MQTACILTGWFAVQFPVMVYIAGGQHLTVWNSSAPEKTMYYLLYALIVGIVLIFPAFAYLFKVFKFRKRDKGQETEGHSMTIYDLVFQNDPEGVKYE